jgi:serine/threonine protein kinase/tetratricopeptide (TPR) repeat protein
MLISNKYEVEGLLGKGSMGEVYKVRHVTLGTLSALKVLPSKLMEYPDLLARFYREARVMAKLIHPNIVRVIDIDHDDKLKFHYIVMEFIQGRTLREYLEEKTVLTLKEILLIGRQIGQALQFAHNNEPPVIHRDIKPSNIMLEHSSHRAVLMDFGIAKELDEANMTKCDMMLGTVRYCPREQMLYEPLTGSADIYALGMIMFEAYTGDHFFAGLNENQIISSVLSDQENEPVFNAGTPAEFQTLIKKSIAKSRSDRYQNMSEFLSDLEACWLRNVEIKEPKYPPEMNPDNITDLDEHIRKLELEKQKRAALSGQTGCRDAREKALREEADQLAREIFLEGCRQESAGADFLNQKDFPPAQEAFRSGAEIFAEAYRKAAVVRLQKQTEQIKQQVHAVKTEADGYNAKENARTFYGRALDFQSQAEEFLEKSSYKEAYEKFSEAFRVYQDARELAYYKSLKEGTQALCEKVKQAYEEAVKVEAKELAPTLFRKAFAIEQKAKTAYSSEDLQQAHELFRSALENYSLARQHVLDQRKQLDMAKTRKQALELWHRAQHSGAEQRFGTEFAKALELKEQGEYWEAQHKPEQASEYYLRAADAFDRLYKETEILAARDQVEVIQQQLANAKAKFKTLRTWAKKAWAEADGLVEEADSAWQAGQYLQARKTYIKALEAYTQAQQQAIAEQCNEQVQSFQPKLQESRQVAEHYEVESHCRTSYRQAVSALTQGQDSLDKGGFQDALEHFKKAREYFDQSVLERYQQLKSEIASIQQQAKELQAPDYAGTLYHKGLISVLEAEELWEQSCQIRSYDTYREAMRLFKEACELAARRRSKEEAETAQAQAREAFEEAVAADAKERFTELFQQAVQSQARADAALRKEEYAEARDLYGSAIESFVRAHQSGLDLIKQAREQADEFQRLAAQAGADPEQDSYQQALLAYQNGEDYVNQKAYKQALAAFQSAHEKYQQLWKETENERKLQTMLAVKEKAEKERSAAEQFETGNRNSEEFIKAVGLMEQAHQWSAFKNHEKAADFYEQAYQAFECATVSAQRAPDLRSQEEEKTIISIKEPKQDKRPSSSFFGGGRGLMTGLAVVVFLMGVYWLFDSDSVKKRDDESPSRSELTMGKVNPAAESLFLLDGHSQFFSIEVPGRNKDELDFTWFLDGEKQAKSEKWIFKPVFNKSEAADKEIKVVITDRQGHSLQKIWKIKVIPSVQPQPAPVPAPAPAPVPVKPVNHPPQIVKFEPADRTLTLRKKEAVIFSAEAVDQDADDRMIYSWTLDGKEISRNIGWIYKATEAGKHTVALTVADKENLQAKQTWNIVVSEPEKSRAPRLVKSSPSEQKIEVPLGGEINFSAEATGSDPREQLSYRWFLDKQESSAGNTWLYKARTEGRQKVVLKVADKAGKLAQRSWTVIVSAPSATCVTVDENNELCLPHPAAADKGDSKDKPAEVASKENGKEKSDQKTEAKSAEQKQPLTIGEIYPPEGKIEISLDNDVHFSVAVSGGDPDHQPVYLWTLDGRKQSSDRTWLYQPKAKGKHKIALKVTDKKKVLAKRSWLVVATAPAETCTVSDKGEEACEPGEPADEKEASQGAEKAPADKKAAPGKNQGPSIVKVTPSEQKMELLLGSKIDFSVEASDPDPDDQLTYAWSLDGQPQSNSKTWPYKPQTEGRHKVVLKVADKAGKLAQRTWSITVTAPPATCITVEDGSELCLPDK